MRPNLNLQALFTVSGRSERENAQNDLARREEERAMALERRIRVLIVDDEPRFRAIAAAALRKRGFEVVSVDGGIGAMEKVVDSEVDVVVLDVRMPGMDGNQTLHALKALKPEVEVIILTGHMTADSEWRAGEDGVSAYLTKPCDIDYLAEQIRRAFDQRKRPLKFF
jgi:DNA-binding NtrC family response regulator